MRAIAIALCLACLSSACGRGPDSEEEDAAEAPAATEEREISVSETAAKTFPTALAEAAEAPAVITASGRVLDTATLVEAASALATAELSADSAARDLSRTRVLARDRANASERELAAAELAAAQARGVLAAARARALASFGTADSARLARLAEALGRGTLGIARIELPAGAALPGPHDEISVIAPALGGGALQAHLLGLAGALDPSVQGRAVLVSLAPSPPPSGAALEATLALGAPLHGVWLPESAVVWSDGAASAFVATRAARFTQRELVIARPLRDGYLVSSGVAAGERFVASGAQQLLSTQRVSAEPEED